MNILLKIKNWQLFLLVLLLPWLVAIGLTSIIEFNHLRSDILLAIFTATYYLIFIGWNYKVIKTFNKNEKILKIKQIKRLDWLLVILILYSVFLGLPYHVKTSELLIIRIGSPILMILSAYAIFFTVFCTAKTLKYMQLKDQTRTADIIVEMFIILYFPIGVWWLQRKVNKYYVEIKSSL